MRGILRRLVGCRQPFTSSGRSSELGQTLMVSSAATISYSTVTFMEKPNLLCGFPIAANLLPDFQSRHVLNHYRNFSAPSSSVLRLVRKVGGTKPAVLVVGDNGSTTRDVDCGVGVGALHEFKSCGELSCLSGEGRGINSLSPEFRNGPSNIISIESEEQFNSSLRKVQDESLPAIFYFTAVWCGPCRLLSPVIGQLSEKYPHVTTYKVDIDKEGLGNALSKLNIHSVPTLHFFQNGKKTSEVIGADVQRLKDTMEELYK